MERITKHLLAFSLRDKILLCSVLMSSKALSSKPQGEILSPANSEESLMNAFIPIIQSKGGINLPTWVWQPSQNRLRKNDDAKSDPEGVYYIKVKKINLHTPAYLSQSSPTSCLTCHPLRTPQWNRAGGENDKARPRQALFQITQQTTEYGNTQGRLLFELLEQRRRKASTNEVRVTISKSSLKAKFHFFVNTANKNLFLRWWPAQCIQFHWELSLSAKFW